VGRSNQSVYAPKPLDMAILSSREIDDRHRKAYLVMEIVPQETADKVVAKEEYQIWDYQKPFIMDVLKTMGELLHVERIFNSDLKRKNTLFDPLSDKWLSSTWAAHYT
jgi:hypothetical protein